MRTWAEYQKTMRAEDLLFVRARSGDVAGLRGHSAAELIGRTDARGSSALMLATYYGHADAVKFLLALGADPNGRDNTGNSVLMGAAFKGYLSLVRMLIEAGADPERRSPRGLTALQYAQMFGRTDVARYLKTHQQQPQSSSSWDLVSGWASFLFPQRSTK